MEKRIGQIKLWGKIKGTKRDYFIAEGTLEAGEAEVPEGVEARGTGLNKFVYWATNSACSEWCQLPDIKPQDVLNARNIRHCFTGDLSCNIYTNPYYFDTE